MQISAIQIDVRLGDLEANLRRAAEAIEQAAGDGSQLAVLPECMLSGYCFDSREAAWEAAIRRDDPRWQGLAKVLAPTSMHAVLGFLERGADGRLYNASAIVGGQGVLAVYRKVHLPQLGVDRFVDPGTQPYDVHPVGAARVGLAICYDSSFPEIGRAHV